MADPKWARGQVIPDPNAGVQGGIPAPGGFEGGVLQKGRPTAEAYKWRCPTCGNEWTTPLEQGCPRCKETAEAIPRHQDIPLAPLMEKVLRRPDGQFAAQSIRGGGLSLKARRSVMRALAFYAEAAALHSDELTRQEALSWARLLNQADADEELAIKAQQSQEKP